MPNRMIVQKLVRLTMVRKGHGFIAKHPDNRSDVVEVVKAAEEASPWYQDFDTWLSSQDDLGEDPLADFSESLKDSASKKNYPDSEGPFAGPHNSFPIRSASDVLHAAQRLHNAKGNKASIKARIKAIARAHGYSLPKTWGESTEKSVSTKLELVNQLLAVLKAEEAEADETETETPAAPETPVETPAEPETPAVETPAAETPAEPEAPAPEAVDKASKMPPHDHDHAHVTTFGYSYNHSHPHGDDEHANADDHGTSETLHAHEHVAKAGGFEMDGLIADRDGLKKDLDAAKLELESLKEKLSAAESKKDDAEKRAARKPLVAATAGGTAVTKAAPQISSDMKYEDVFDSLLGRAK